MKFEFEKIYRRFRRPIFHYVSARMTDPHLAEEVTQEVFLKAYRAHGSFDRRFSVSTWLWTIARNTVTDFFRKSPLHLHTHFHEHAHGHAHYHEHHDGHLTGVENFPCPSLDPEHALITRAEKMALHKIVAGLTELQKKALSLHLIQRLSNREIAHSLGLSLSATKALVHRAKRAVFEHGGGPALGKLALQMNM